jgi:hypothetical protein
VEYNNFVLKRYLKPANNADILAWKIAIKFIGCRLAQQGVDFTNLQLGFRKIFFLQTIMDKRYHDNIYLGTII